MTEAFELEFNGVPAGSGMIHQTQDGFGFVWTRPDEISIFRGGFESAQECGEALTDEVVKHYGSVQ